MSFLEIKGLFKTYRGAEKPTLQDINITLEEGEILVLLGPSGCGKTTLLKTIAGLEEQDSGEILVDGGSIDRLPTEKRPISMVFQKAHMFKNMTVAKNINFAPRVRGMFSNREEMDSETQKYIDLVKLTGLEDRMATQLSGGQEQRVSLARALIVKPKLLLLDEPLSALDAGLRIEMRTAVRDICKQLGQTVLFVTHDQEEAMAIGDRIAVMFNGKIEQCATPEVFFSRPASKKVAEFFGWKNTIPCNVDGENNISSAIGNFKMDASMEPGERLLIIRPEAFSEDENGNIRGAVKHASYLGVRVEYVIDVNGIELNISSNSREVKRIGETMSLNVDPEGMWVVDDELEEEEKVQSVKKGFFSRRK